MTSLTESFNRLKHAPLYENKQNVREIIQWRLLLRQVLRQVLLSTTFLNLNQEKLMGPKLDKKKKVSKKTLSKSWTLKRKNAVNKLGSEK